MPSTRRFPRRRTAARAEQLRKSRLPGVCAGRGAPVVVKFYRPGRWTDDADRRRTRVRARARGARNSGRRAAQRLHGARCITYGGFRFAVYPRHGGRAPELDDPDTLDWLGRFIGRIHAVGATATLRAPARARHRELRRRAARFLLDHDFIPADLRRGLRSVTAKALAGVAPLLRARRRRGDAAPARRLPRGQRAVDRRRARISSISTMRAWGPRCRTCGCCCPATATR